MDRLGAILRVVAGNNVETVRRVYEAFAQRSDEVVREDALLSQWHEDGRFYPLLLGGGALEGAVYEGHEGLRRFARELADESWSEVTVELLDVREMPRDRVLAHPRVTAVGESSGAPVQTDSWAVFTFHDGKIIEGRVFADEAAALAYGCQ
jgi:ketosteroid isomerase-like protein